MINVQRLIANGEWLGKRVEEKINLESWVRCPSEPRATIRYSRPKEKFVSRAPKSEILNPNNNTVNGDSLCAGPVAALWRTQKDSWRLRPD